MGWFDKLSDKKKTKKVGFDRDTKGSYWQKIAGIEPFVSDKKDDFIRVTKYTLKVIEGALPVGTETSQVIKISGNRFVEDDVRKFYCGVSGESMEAANETSFAQIEDRLKQLVGVTARVDVKERAYTDAQGEAKTFTDSHVICPILPDQLAEEGIDPNKFG